MSERLQAQMTILQQELKEVKDIQGKRKERASGKRMILKDKSILSTEEVYTALKEAEEKTARKKTQKKMGKSKRKSQRQEAPSSQSEDESSCNEAKSSVRASPDLPDIEILDCIEVAL
jgi:hypothetical protein